MTPAPSPEARSDPGPFPPTLPRFVGVLGGGRMGAGIAHAFLMAGCTVTVVERDGGAAAAARARVERAVAASVERELDVEPDVERGRGLARDVERELGLANGSPGDGAAAREIIGARLRLSTDYADFAPCALVVEAVPENQELKSTALRAVEKQLDPAAFLATNSSALSVTGLAAALERPENLIGLHFFNPVPASRLVEIITGSLTSPALAAAALGWVAALGKTAVTVQDSPGFASSRLGVLLALEAMRMLEEGVSSAEDIDNAMVLGYRHQTGPLRTTDLVGLDVRLKIAEYLGQALGERFTPPQILRDKVARGELGRKTGKGFFDWA